MANLTFVRDSTKNLIEKSILICTESVDAVFARNSDIFIADTLSDQNKNQLNQRKISWLELRNHRAEDTILNFKEILRKLDIPFSNRSYFNE